MPHMNAGRLEERQNGQEQVWQAERPRLVALCARLTGDRVAAEDLAQETLIEAWRHRDDLRDPERERQWLGGIARNVSLRWLRARSRSSTRARELPALTESDDTTAPTWDDVLAGDADVAFELERHELSELLDSALALLPPETRAPLLAHYIEQTPLAELAHHLGTSDAAVAMRLQRGKLALRRILTNELHQQFAPHAPDLYERHSWEETPLWCTNCGRRRLIGRYHVAEGEIWLRCVDCSPDPALTFIHATLPGVLQGVRGYKRARDRMTAWEYRFYTPHARERSLTCPDCGTLAPITHERPHYTATSRVGNDLGLRAICPSCGCDCWETLDRLALVTPAGRAFTRENPRIRTLPYRRVEAQGRQAIVVSFESVTSARRFDVLAAADTFEILSTGE